MPWGDRTGPLGLGPRTGRGLGLCSGYTVPGYLNFGIGYKYPPAYGYPYVRGAPFFLGGRGRGFGRGWRRFGRW